jgi:flagellar capping protein FliD
MKRNHTGKRIIPERESYRKIYKIGIQVHTKKGFLELDMTQI